MTDNRFAAHSLLKRMTHRDYGEKKPKPPLAHFLGGLGHQPSVGHGLKLGFKMMRGT